MLGFTPLVELTFRVNGQTMLHHQFDKIDIIWNITSICMWDCGICCVDATHVQSKNGVIAIKSENLNEVTHIKHDRQQGNIFDQALASRVAAGLELSLNEKLMVLENLEGFNIKLDFSGGDPLAISDTKIVMQKASALFGQKNITLTATGGGLTRVDVTEIAPMIGELNFTYDSANIVVQEHRPNGYAYSNLKKAAQFAKVGVKIRGETPLTINNIDEKTLTQIYLNLHEANVSTHLIMRLFPSGRGIYLKHKIPSAEQYRKAIDLLFSLENKYGFPKIKLQCALKFLDINRKHLENPCDLVTKSFGLMPNGVLLASPWAISNTTTPVSDVFNLGNLAKTKMADILATEKVKRFVSNADNNFGHCKMHAFFSGEDNREALIFTKSDPLYQ